MRLSRCLAALLFLAVASPVAAFEACKFSFRIDAQSSAFQALVEGASVRGGFWRPIREAPDDVQQIARFVGRLDVCLMTPDGAPRQVTVGGQTVTLQSPQVTTCTAALLPGNRLLTNRHCFYDDNMVAAGFSIVQEVRINFGYTSADFTDAVQTFLVSSRELASDARHDALVLQVVGADANTRMGGHIPMVMETRATPRRALTMIHHPQGQPQQFSSGTCQVHPDQADLPEDASQLRHSCETSGGSSGSLLLDARSLAVVGLHNQGGLGARGGYNGGHKIAAVEAALGLGFRRGADPVAPVDPEVAAQAALTEALQIAADAARRAALEAVVADFPGSRAAVSAGNTLAFMAPKAQTREEQATAALIAALQMAEGGARTAKLESIRTTFAGTAAARSAAAVLRSVAVAPAPAPEKPPARVSDTEALAKAALGRALRMSDADMRRRALETLQERYPETLAATGASQLLARLSPASTQQVSPAQEADARAALGRALAMSDREMRALALAKVQERHPETVAATEARAALARLTTSRPKVARAEEADAHAALGRALAMSDREMQGRALALVQKRYPGTAAATEAREGLARLSLQGDTADAPPASALKNIYFSLGMAYAEKTPGLNAHYDLSLAVNGVVVTQVQPGSAAQRAGIAAGDVITAVDGKRLRQPAQVRAALRGGTHRLTLVRDGRSMTARLTGG